MPTTIEALVRIQNGTITYFDINQISLVDLKFNHELSSRWYLLIKYGNDLPQNTTWVDLSLLLTETKIGKLTTWISIQENITDALIESYAIILPIDSNHYVTTTNLLNSEDFDLHYTSFKSPEERDVRQFRWRLTDLAIQKVNTKNYTNFKNCICSVNGLVSMPTVFNNELLVRDGALYMSSTTDTKWPSVVLIDFSGLGDIELVPFSKCSIIYKNKDRKANAYSDVKLYMPEHITLKNKTIFPVVAHSLFFPKDVTITSNTSVILSPYKLPISTSLLKLYNHSGKFIRNTDIVKTDVSVEEYLTTNMFSEDDYGNFFIIVNNPSVYMTKTHAVTFSNSTYTTSVQDGILFDQTTQSFYDYVKNPYNFITDLYTVHNLPIYPLDVPYSRPCISLTDWNCVHNELSPNLALDDLYLLRIFGI